MENMEKRRFNQKNSTVRCLHELAKSSQLERILLVRIVTACLMAAQVLMTVTSGADCCKTHWERTTAHESLNTTNRTHRETEQRQESVYIFRSTFSSSRV